MELYIGEASEDDADTYGEDLEIPSYKANSGGGVDIVFTNPDPNDNVNIHDGAVVAPDGCNANNVVDDEINETLWKDFATIYR